MPIEALELLSATPNASPLGDAATGLSDPSPATLGARLQRVRLRQNLSVRDLAEKSDVNKNTILRMEKGLTPSYSTLTRVCAALGIHVAQLTQPEPDEELVALYRDDRKAPRLRIIPGGKNNTEPTVLHQRAGELSSFASDEGILLSVLTCRLPGSRLNAAVLDLYAESEPVTHPGEELVYCLSGIARLTVAGRPYRLEQGDAAIFWCSERHCYAPSEEMEASEYDFPVRLLSVWIDTREEGAMNTNTSASAAE